jgi:hypothetical protein
MRPVAGVELRQNVGDAALDGHLGDEENIGVLSVGIPGSVVIRVPFY